MKEIRIGNTVGRIVSPLMELTKEERKRYFEEELRKGNPVLKELERIVNESYWRRNGKGRRS
ncbi:hypothetical protein F4694_004087 [Bacillus niacini]|uniref:Uncharacterized protein n=1 Tax=Neobacillus niacini TaxID=86668 RepID=A0A852TEW4_9BACI|nr:hypothetical protein [Neobacillus niacini]NYE07302.1 hypothetical protein [Neobacillus niacini]